MILAGFLNLYLMHLESHAFCRLQWQWFSFTAFNRTFPYGCLSAREFLLSLIAKTFRSIAKEDLLQV
jgi:hypothetical protein